MLCDCYLEDYNLAAFRAALAELNTDLAKAVLDVIERTVVADPATFPYRATCQRCQTGRGGHVPVRRPVLAIYHSDEPQGPETHADDAAAACPSRFERTAECECKKPFHRAAGGAACGTRGSPRTCAHELVVFGIWDKGKIRVNFRRSDRALECLPDALCGQLWGPNLIGAKVPKDGLGRLQSAEIQDMLLKRRDAFVGWLSAAARA